MNPPLAFGHAALVGKPTPKAADPNNGDSVLTVAAFLQRLGAQVSLEAGTASAAGIGGLPVLTPAQIGQQCDIAVVVGGDGTVLGIGRQLAAHDVPLVGINQGRLGFMTDIPFDAFEEPLGKIMVGQCLRESRGMLQATVFRDDAPIFSAVALNDVVVTRGAYTGMVELEVTVDRQFMYRQRADGLIVATPTGSTAYALSANGPLLHPGLRAFVLVPIAPHALSNRPIALCDSSVVEIKVVAGRDANVNFDMQSLTQLLHGDRIVVQRAEHGVTFLHPPGYSYFDTLREKLHWHEF